MLHSHLKPKKVCYIPENWAGGCIGPATGEGGLRGRAPGEGGLGGRRRQRGLDGEQSINQCNGDPYISTKTTENQNIN